MKNRPFLIYFLIITLLILFMFSLDIFAEGQEYIVCSGMKIYMTNNTYIIPSGTEYNMIEYHSVSESFMFNGRKYDSGSLIDVSKGNVTKVYDSTGYVVTIDGKKVTFIKSSEIPFISIDTSMRLSNITKNNRDDETEIRAFDETGKEIYSDISNETFSELKLRGNATASYSKKPYQIKLGKKTDLYGLGKAKTYILLANYIDPSFLRNEIAFEYADFLGMEYTPNCRQVMLYINGECKGLYLLCEKTQINQNRIEIFDLEDENAKYQKDKSYETRSEKTEKTSELIFTTALVSYSYIDGMVDPDDITGGYLVELDNLYSGSEKCKFTTEYGNTYVIKSPECASKNEVEYIATLFAEMEDALYSNTGYNELGKHYSEYIDIDSLAKTFVIEEMAKEWDAFVGSQYFYKDKDKNGITSKIYSGPIWDFDNSWGTIDNGTYASNKTEVWSERYKSFGRPNAENHLGLAISKQPILKSLISKYSSQSVDILLSFAKKGGKLDIEAKRLKDSVSCDKFIWGYTGRLSAFLVYECYTDGDDETTDTAIGYLKDYINKRTVPLSETFSYTLDDNYNEIYFEMDDLEFTSKKFETDKQASFKYYGEPKNLEIRTDQGQIIEHVYDNGFVYFTMPNHNVFVVENKNVEETTQTEITDIAHTEIETETETEQDITTNEKNPVVKKKNNSIWIILSISLVVVISAIIVIFIIQKKKRNKTENV